MNSNTKIKKPMTANTANKPSAKPVESLDLLYERLLLSKNVSYTESKTALKELKLLILNKGLPNEALNSKTSVRCKVWKLLLGTYNVSASEYISLVKKGPTDVHDKIKDDTFRTLATNKKFSEKVNEGMLSRLLNAFVWKMKGINHELGINYRYPTITIVELVVLVCPRHECPGGTLSVFNVGIGCVLFLSEFHTE
jgi:cell cycle arrest protein BUB2